MKFIYSYPNDTVCSRISLQEFGEKTPAYNDEPTLGVAFNEMQAINTFELFVKHLKKACADYDATISFEWKHYAAAYIPKLAIVEAYTCSWQPEAEKNLEELGFIKIGPFKKLKHKVTDLTVWIIGADDLCRRIGYVCSKDPRTPEERGY